MLFTIKPLQGAGIISFGMACDPVRTLLGSRYQAFKRTPDAAFPCDYFDLLGVFVYYKMPGEVEAIEFAAPASLEFAGYDLLAIPYQDLKKLLMAKDKDLVIEEGSLTSLGLGIGVYAPDADEEPDLPATSIIVFAQGYYDGVYALNGQTR